MTAEFTAETQAAESLDQPTPIVRTRTFSWSDPVENASALGQLDGIQTLQAIIDGSAPPPPIMSMLGVDRLEVPERGRVLVYLQPQEFHYNPLGSVHGGALSTLLDTAAGCAVHSALDAGTGYTSLDLSVRFIRAVTVASGMLRCEGTVLSRGRRTAVAEARITDGRGRLVAHATSSCLIFPMTDAAA